MISTTTPSNQNGWNLAFKFYAFDIAVPGTVSYHLQHTVKSIHSVAPCITRHRISMDGDTLPPWEFRMMLYAFPAALEDCSITTQLENETAA